MNPVLQAIVSISLAEMLSEKETDKPIIISEYLLITSNFFGRGETGFVKRHSGQVCKRKTPKYTI
jgi:transcription termination factor NusB